MRMGPTTAARGGSAVVSTRVSLGRMSGFYYVNCRNRKHITYKFSPQTKRILFLLYFSPLANIQFSNQRGLRPRDAFSVTLSSLASPCCARS